MFRVIGTDTYLGEISKWDKSEREAAEKIPKKLAVNPMIGAPLGYPFLRERRVREKRVYYLIYEDLNLVLLVATSGKKDQQPTIDHIKGHLDEFRKIAEDIAKQVS
ncbi:MAG: hypothetical protein IIA87_04240 [Nanoarchaeota archaeon]|nr:hypothetical protein [Nanoarchaeota archaeon]